MNRTRARALWSQVAHGPHDAELQAWLRTVARDMLDADAQADGNRRESALAAATRLRGKVLRDVHDRLLAISFYGVQYPEPSANNPPLREFIANALGWQVSDETADKRIRDALATLRQAERDRYLRIVNRAGRKPRRQI